MLSISVISERRNIKSVPVLSFLALLIAFMNKKAEGRCNIGSVSVIGTYT